MIEVMIDFASVREYSSEPPSWSGPNPETWLKVPGRAPWPGLGIGVARRVRNFREREREKSERGGGWDLVVPKTLRGRRSLGVGLRWMGEGRGPGFGVGFDRRVETFRFPCFFSF
ncbi:hypothetical protein ACLB2K_066272 [Fragaria x ananassa]